MPTIQSPGPSSAVKIVSPGPSGTLVIGGLTPANTLQVSTTPNVQSSGSTSTTETSGDATLNVVTGATTTTTQNLLVSYPLYSSMGTPSLSITNNAPSVATIDGSGVTTYQSTGTASFTVTVTYNGTPFTNQITFPTSQITGPTSYQFNSFLSTSVAYEMCNTFHTLLTAAGSPNPNGNTNLYSSYNYGSSYVRNTSHWAYGYDLTCIPAGNSHWGSAKECGVLVTPQHLLQANHVALPVGTTMVFVANDNSVQTATIASQSGLLSNTGDICVATLSAPLTSAITPATILPSSYATHLPNPQYGYPLAYVEWEQHADSNLYVCDINAPFSPLAGATCLNLGQSTDATRSQWWQTVITGDSGGGVFMLIGGKAVMVSQIWTSVTQPMDAAYISTIQGAISGYALTQADLSSYTP